MYDDLKKWHPNEFNHPKPDLTDKRIHTCQHCGSNLLTLMYRYMSNGLICFKSKCNQCGEKSGSLPYEKPFYESRKWLEIRYVALRKHGFKCLACNRDASDGVKLHVDHIKPRSKYPQLALDINNLQVLCGDCNLGKSNKYEDDLRGMHA